MSKLDDILDTLKDKYGERKTSKKHGTEYLAIPKEFRKDIIRHLVQTLKDQGETKEFFWPNSVRVAVAEWCLPEALTDYWDKKKRDGAYNVVWRELKEVLAEIFPSEISVARAPEKVANEYDPSKHKSFAKELDRSVLAAAPKPNTTVDDEMSKLLGFKDE